MLLTKEESSFVVVPDGVYTAELADYKETTGKFGPNLKLFFNITGPIDEYVGASVTMLCPKKLQVGNKLDLALQALGIIAEVGQDVDIDSVLGVPCSVLVATKDQDGKTYSNIMKILPPAPARPAPRPVAAAPAPRPVVAAQRPVAAAPAARPVAAAPAQRPVPPRQAPQQAPAEEVAPAPAAGPWD
jgi:hypothetical protein